MADAFDLDEDTDDHYSAHESSSPLTHNRQTPSATGHVFPRETTSIPGAYDFEREYYDFPPPRHHLVRAPGRFQMIYYP